MLVSRKGFIRTWQDLPTCHRHSFHGGLVVQSQFNAVHISAVFIKTIVTHIPIAELCLRGTADVITGHDFKYVSRWVSTRVIFA